jgi:hypothetical protein
MDFNSRQFRAFLLVAQHRSFSRAAEAALHHSIRLECFDTRPGIASWVSPL